MTNDKSSVYSGLFVISHGVNVPGKQCLISPSANKAALCLLFTGRAYFPQWVCFDVVGRGFVADIYTRPGGCGILWAHLTQGAQAARIQKSTSHSTLSICCAAWVVWLLFHGREGWLTLPEPLILGQLEPREISVKIDHKECTGDKRLCVFYSFLTSSGWIFLLMGRIKGSPSTALWPMCTAALSHVSEQWGCSDCAAHKKGLTHCSFSFCPVAQIFWVSNSPDLCSFYFLEALEPGWWKKGGKGHEGNTWEESCFPSV